MHLPILPTVEIESHSVLPRKAVSSCIARIKKSLILSLCVVSFDSPVFAQTIYDFGNPNGSEQLYIELINRTRANPPAEGARLAATTDPAILAAYASFGVNLAMMQSEHSSIAPTPPLAPNAALTSAARGHSNWMLANAIQSHNQGSVTASDRVIAAGYNWAALSENIYAYSTSVPFAHAGFEVDWGTGGTGGMQNGRSHRTSINNAAYREIGVGVTTGSNGAVGPSLVTQDFGRQQNTPTFATGVAYYDLNGNNFYDQGEGVSGLTVTVSGASYYCETALGGGWVVPVPATAAIREVTFSGLSINQTSSISIPASANAKLDLKLSYSAPLITSPSTAYLSTPYNLSFTPVPGAASYKWKYWNLSAALNENAENTSNVSLSLLGGYSAINSNVKSQGNSSFHLVNGITPGTQWIELSGLYMGQGAASMAFQSRLRYSTSSEEYKVQVKEEGTSTWVDVYSQTGLGNSGEAAFSQRSVTLSMMEGKLFRVRFLLKFSNGSWYNNSGDNFGWFIDAIQFSNIQQLQNEINISLAGNFGSFTPSAAGSYLQAVVPIISGNEFPSAVQTLTVSSSPPPRYASWAAAIEATNSLVAGTLTQSSDYDNDGRSNLLEYAFGTSPVISNDLMTRMPTLSRDVSNLYLTYQVDASLTDLAFSVEAGSSMTGWKTPGQTDAPVGFGDQLVSTSGSIETRRAVLPLSSGVRNFMRVRVRTIP